MMTFLTVHKILDQNRLDPDKIRIKILTPCTYPHLCGTSAQLLPKDKVTISELLYGMMLPSGNDAAQSLGIYFGNLILKQELKEKGSSQIGLSVNIDGNINEEDYPDDVKESSEEPQIEQQNVEYKISEEDKNDDEEF
jgi:hypothetical protein